jgi:hypothetical protein
MPKTRNNLAWLLKAPECLDGFIVRRCLKERFRISLFLLKEALSLIKINSSLCGKKSYLDKIKIMQKIKRPYYPTVCLEKYSMHHFGIPPWI